MNADQNRLLDEARAQARHLLPLLDPPETRPVAWRRKARSWRTATRNLVENRRRARAGREDLLPLYFIWTTLRPCNFSCTYCDDHRGNKYPDLSPKGQLDTAGGVRVLEVMRTRTPSVYFAGGEPTIRADLPALTRAARDLGYHPIVVNTNASVLHKQLEKPAWRGWLADVDIIVVSLDALDLDVLRDLWVTKRPEDVLRNLFLLRELAGPMGVKLMVNAVVQPGGVHHARAVLDLCEELGIWFNAVPQNEGPRVAQGLANDPAYDAFVDHLLARKRAGARISGSLRLLERLLRSAPLTCRNTLKPHVDHDGMLFWPCKAMVNQEPVHLDVRAFEDVDAIWAAGVAQVDPKGFHGPGPDQCGASCNWAQNYTTDAYANGLLHPVELLREVVEFVGSR